MSDSDNIIDVSDQSFEREVIERSRSVPVLVDYWADWCGPCQMQLPVLKKLVEDYAGKFVLAKVNTDEQRELARAHGIRSLPTMRLYKQGELVEEVLAAQTESTLRILLDRYIERESDKVRARALETWSAGDHDAALAMLEAAHAAEPDNHQLAMARIDLLMQHGALDAAEALLAALPRDVRDEQDATQLAARLQFARACQGSDIQDLQARLQQDPDDHEARYRLAAHYVAEAQWEAALDNLMTLFQRGRDYDDGAARKGLLAVFELLGNQGELVNRYRRQLSALML